MCIHALEISRQHEEYITYFKSVIICTYVPQPRRNGLGHLNVLLELGHELQLLLLQAFAPLSP